jgi:ethanolamine-phosphate cytidylyltransferase
MAMKRFISTKGFITRPTLFNTEERKMLVSACRWVDEAGVIPEYVPTLSILDKFKVDYVMHGDDVINDANGESIYTPFIKAGKYKSVYQRVQANSRHIHDRYHRTHLEP